MRRGRKATGPRIARSAGPPKGASRANILNGTAWPRSSPSRCFPAAPPQPRPAWATSATPSTPRPETPTTRRRGARNNVLVLQSYQVPLMQRLKAANPNLKILIYKDLSGMVERDQWGGVSTGVATQDAATHPEWFLQNTSGQRFTFRYYDWIWAADVGNAGLPAEVGRQRARRDGHQGLGRRLHGRHQPEHGATTTTSPGSPSTRPTRPTRPPPARRWPRSARASAPPASS